MTSTIGVSVVEAGTSLHSTERVHNANAVVVAAGLQIFGQHLPATGGARGFDDGGVPIADPIPFLAGEHGFENRDCQLLDEESQPGLDQGDSLPVLDWVGSRRASGLDVELLQHLNGELRIAQVQDFVRPILQPSRAS